MQSFKEDPEPFSPNLKRMFVKILNFSKISFKFLSTFHKIISEDFPNYFLNFSFNRQIDIFKKNCFTIFFNTRLKIFNLSLRLLPGSSRNNHGVSAIAHPKRGKFGGGTVFSILLPPYFVPVFVGAKLIIHSISGFPQRGAKSFPANIYKITFDKHPTAEISRDIPYILHHPEVSLRKKTILHTGQERGKGVCSLQR